MKLTKIPAIGKEVKVKGWKYPRIPIHRTGWIGETLERIRNRAEGK